MGKVLGCSLGIYRLMKLEIPFQAVFDHKSETPGLGAEISKILKMVWKIISNEDTYHQLKLMTRNPLNEYQVDGISGGTFTSVGVEEMMSRTLVVYHKYIKKLNKS